MLHSLDSKRPNGARYFGCRGSDGLRGSDVQLSQGVLVDGWIGFCDAQVARANACVKQGDQLTDTHFLLGASAPLVINRPALQEEAAQ